ncbi:family 43 glycosylhydrolase [Nocardiopsis synnemataformans]|uniref:glycoside hydrolase family 43 protein n=1 Tax=Nocardiopsis synnemataformans TaxID=61305 RepID=UPI003EBCDEF2
MAVNERPVLAGFHPDPSVCRVGEDYYLANSSFEYLPGVPLHRSRDLVRWEQIGNVLDRDEQITLSGRAGGGVYAPTLRHHGGLFWMVTTNVEEFAKGHLIVHAEDPAGPWSTPVHTAGAMGIDPDLAWDADGSCYLTWAQVGAEHPITQARVDPFTGELLSPPATLWCGTGLAHPEGPHLHHRGGWWYLTIAEGGTERGHAVSVARSRSVTGPFEGDPANPVLTHRSTDHPVQNTGHADLVELPSGEWAAVHLGVRPRGTTPGFHVNGRETFLTGIRWEDDWPVFEEDRHSPPEDSHGFDEDFSGDVLHPRWIAPGLNPGRFAAPTGTGGVVLTAVEAPAGASEDRDHRRLLATRVRDAEWEARAVLDEGLAALVLRMDDRHWAGVEAHGSWMVARAVVGGLDHTLARVPLPGHRVELCVRAVAPVPGQEHSDGPDVVELGYRDREGFHPLGRFDGRYLSTEVAGGFTGRVVGVAPLSGVAVLRSFHYHPLP